MRQNHFRYILRQLRFDEQQGKEQQIRRMGQECRVWTKSGITDGGSKATKGVYMDGLDPILIESVANKEECISMTKIHLDLQI